MEGWIIQIHKGICIENNQKLIAINSVSDYIHILLGLKPAMALSDLVKAIKTNSRRFINENKWIKGKFKWQEGYGAFSYSHSQIGTVVTYIENQEMYHRKKSFKDEYIELLEKFQIKYDSNYLFEWID